MSSNINLDILSTLVVLWLLGKGKFLTPQSTNKAVNFNDYLQFSGGRGFAQEVTSRNFYRQNIRENQGPAASSEH